MNGAVMHEPPTLTAAQRWDATALLAAADVAVRRGDRERLRRLARHLEYVAGSGSLEVDALARTTARTA